MQNHPERQSLVHSPWSGWVTAQCKKKAQQIHALAGTDAVSGRRILEKTTVRKFWFSTAKTQSMLALKTPAAAVDVDPTYDRLRLCNFPAVPKSANTTIAVSSAPASGTDISEVPWWFQGVKYLVFYSRNRPPLTLPPVHAPTSRTPLSAAPAPLIQLNCLLLWSSFYIIVITISCKPVVCGVTPTCTPSREPPQNLQLQPALWRDCLHMIDASS